MTPLSVRLLDLEAADKLAREGNIFRFLTGKWYPANQSKPKLFRFCFRNVLLREPCVYCGNPQSDGLDHILAQSRNGPNGWVNRAPACRKCDSSKGSQSVLLFLARNKERKQRQARFMERLRKKHEQRKNLPC